VSGSDREPGVLGRIVADTRDDVAARAGRTPLFQLERSLAELEAERAPRDGHFRAALQREGLSVIAEHKRRSPSAGVLRDGADVVEIVRAYESGGAAALSILTEERNFGGSLADLEAARATTTLPLLRKDFTVDRYQLYEAALAGADAVLLIVSALDDADLAGLYRHARELSLDVLVEVHDRAELERALAIEPAIVGVNNRDLRDFSVDVRRTLELLDAIPPGTIVVSESGLHSRELLRELADSGVHAVLIGEALMRAVDPALALAELGQTAN
jgi:indole-3-glycerol phosphate synthase